jgi:hypothetical protein
MKIQVDKDHIVIDADIREEDASFDHAFGTQEETEIVCEVEKVTMYFGEDTDSSIDITKNLTDRDLEKFKDIVIEEYIKTHHS